MKLTSFEEFANLARRGTFVPVCKEIMADLLTPVSAFLKIAEHSDYAFLLESVEGGEQVARYSFLGKDPFLILRARDGRTAIERDGESSAAETPFLDVLRSTMAGFRSPHVPGLPRFTGGRRRVSRLRRGAVVRARAAAAPRRGRPRHRRCRVHGVRHGAGVRPRPAPHPAHGQRARRADDDLLALYQFACAKIEFLERELERSLSLGAGRSGGPADVRSNLTREAFEAHVTAAKSAIAAGEIYQVVLSQRFETRLSADPFTVYRALRHVNPSPYMFFIRMGATSIVGASPEMLVRVEGRRVETHPIAGTRPRGADAEEDLRLADELKASEKERAEHVMLVDLGRNDIGRVADYGSVRVPQYMALERYSHVMHLVSIVEGRLAEGRDRLDALVACFPAGTVSGAPKVRAMEIIASLEPTRRGIYAGAVGYLDFAGNLDFCIAIRTIVIEGRRALVQAGAGIVADSDPAAEYDETRDKARALLRALELAERGL